MHQYRIELIVDNFEFPQSVEFLRSPIGIFCREMNHKRWLVADADSTGHQLMADFARQFPSCFKEELIEVDFDAEYLEEVATREMLQDSTLQHQYRKRTQPPLIPKYSIFQTPPNGKRQGLRGFEWHDIEEGAS